MKEMGNNGSQCENHVGVDRDPPTGSLSCEDGRVKKEQNHS